jgi:hypothetical protein
VSDNPQEHKALSVALTGEAGGRDLGDLFDALDAMDAGQLRRFTTACEWLAMHGRGELDNRRREGK